MKILPVSKVPFYSKTSIATDDASSNKNITQESKKTLSDKNLKSILIPTAVVLTAGFAIKAIIPSSKPTAIKKTEIKPLLNYKEELAESLSSWLNKKIEVSSLDSIITGKELLEELKNLNKENFVASLENIESGVYSADLHSHSLFSDGKAEVKTILDQVAEYADKLNQKNGKKFIFSLTDHDSAEGVKEALKIITEDPSKFKNVKFVTGAELSFFTKVDKGNPLEASEVLVYGFNPFDKKTEDYFKNLYQRREKMVTNYIEDMKKILGDAEFSKEEFEKFYGNNYIMNTHWKVYNYGHTKNALAGLAGEKGVNKTDFYAEIMQKIEKVEDRNFHYLQRNSYIPETYGQDSRIDALCKNNHSPKLYYNYPYYAHEVEFSEIIDAFAHDENTFGAFAHPYYITEKVVNSEALLNNLINQSRGFIKGAEIHHQAYKGNIDEGAMNFINEYFSKKNRFLSLGGQDNHNVDWMRA